MARLIKPIAGKKLFVIQCDRCGWEAATALNKNSALKRSLIVAERFSWHIAEDGKVCLCHLCGGKQSMAQSMSSQLGGVVSAVSHNVIDATCPPCENCGTHRIDQINYGAIWLCTDCDKTPQDIISMMLGAPAISSQSEIKSVRPIQTSLL